MAFGLLAPSTVASAFQEDGLSTAPPATTYNDPSGAETNPDDTVYDGPIDDPATSNTTTYDPAFDDPAFDSPVSNGPEDTGPDNTMYDNTGPDNTVYDGSTAGDPCDPEIYPEAASDPFCSGVATTSAYVPPSSTANRFTDALASLSTDDTPLADLRSDEAQVIGAGRMLLAIDAIAELGGFERAVTPGGAVLLRDIREDILAAGLNEAGYTRELEKFIADFIPFLKSLEADGVAVSPDLWEAADGLEAVLSGDVEPYDDLGLLEPRPWLLGIADLLVRGGERPSTPDLEGDEQAIRELLAAFALAPVENTTTTTTPEQDTPPPSVLALETEPDVITAEPSNVPTFLAVGGVAAALLVGLVFFLRRRRPKRRLATGPSALRPEAESSTTPVADREPAASKASVTELLDASRRMSASLDAATIASIALAEAKRIVGAEGGIVVRRTDDGLDPVGCEPPMLFNYEHIADGCLPRVVETGQSTAAITHDEPLLVEVPMAMGAVPIVTDGVVTGAILVVRISAQPFDRDELDALEMLAPLVGSAFAVADTHETAVDVEPLTGLQNRRRLDLDLAAISTDEEVAYVMVDIDHFKNFNDTNGHAAGDEALRQVSALLQASVRPNDLVYRYGGEEFCVLLPATTAEEAAVVAERARVAVESAQIPGMENQPAGKVTISVGVSDSAFGTPDELVERADAALYVSKRNGRNQVTLSPTE